MVSFDFLKPIKGHVDPSIDFLSVQKRHEVDALGNGVFGDVCFTVHEHKPVELV